MKLSALLGYPHPDYLFDDLTAEQLHDWALLSKVSGLPYDRNDLHWGMLISLLRNVHRGKSDKAVRVTECMPYYHAEPSPEEVRDKIKAMVSKAKALANKQVSIGSIRKSTNPVVDDNQRPV